ncbi:MAG: type I restriction endonuclease, partial [Candidatus Micrarchaeaceae archaeon]
TLTYCRQKMVLTLGSTLNSTLGRETTEQVVLEWRLKAALEKLNPDVPPLALDLAVDELTKDRSVLSSVRANQEVHKLLKDGVKVTYRTSDDNEAIRLRLVNIQGG